MRQAALSWCLVVAATLAAAAPPPAAAGGDPAGSAAILYRTQVSDANLMGVTVSNYGFVGNNFITRSPSMEYPLGTGYEHLVSGGLWVGARGADGAGAFTRVTSGCLEIPQGTSPAQASEFTPTGDQIRIRSNRPTSPFYHPEAVSELDLMSEFDDLTPRTTTGNPQTHRPLGLIVRQETFAWSAGRLAHVVFFRFVIRSAGPVLTDLHAGLFTLLASGPKNAYATWPPSSSGSSLGSWYRKAWLAYDPPLRLLREHFCMGLPVPTGCNLGIVPYWAGLELLTPTGPAGPRATLAAWRWAPADPARDEDVERYALMSTGTVADLAHPDLMPVTGDPVELLAVGPFPVLGPGDSLVVGFALLGGGDVGDIQENAAVAQSAWDANFGNLPTAVAVSRTAVDPRPDRVAIAWQVSEPGAAFAIERRGPAAADWTTIARPFADGTGRIALEDREVVSGARYGYRLRSRASEDAPVLDEVWVDVPGAAALGIDGWDPPSGSGGRLRVALTLAGRAPATLTLLDPAGRRLHAQRLDGLGPGRHVVTLEGPRDLPAGVFFLRLSQDGHIAGRRVVVLP